MQHLVATKPFVKLNNTKFMRLRISLLKVPFAKAIVVNKSPTLDNPKMQVPHLPRLMYDADHLARVSHILNMKITVKLWVDVIFLLSENTSLQN